MDNNGYVSNEVSTHSHNLVLEASTSLPMFSEDGEMVLLCRISDGSLCYYPLEAVENVFGSIKRFQTDNITTVMPISDASTSSSTSSVPNHEMADQVEVLPSTSKDIEGHSRTSWTQKEKDVLRLINLYKDHSSLFKSQTIRHEKVWKMIAEKMPGFSTEQVKNKFKYLKGRYVKKIENMSDKASGAEKFIFEYFEEFNQLFGKDPNIKPIALASSLKKRKLDHEEIPDISGENEENSLCNMTLKEKKQPSVCVQTPKKKEKNLANKIENLSEVLMDLRQDLNRREKERERRHEEDSKRKEEATNAFKDYLNFLKEKDSKK